VKAGNSDVCSSCFGVYSGLTGGLGSLLCPFPRDGGHPCEVA